MAYAVAFVLQLLSGSTRSLSGGGAKRARRSKRRKKHNCMHEITSQLTLQDAGIQNKPGVYFVSQEPLGEKPTLVKIGESLHLQERLDKYLLYWPSGFYIHGVVYHPRACRIETLVHEHLRKKNRSIRSELRFDRHCHLTEWFCMSKADLMATIKGIPAYLQNADDIPRRSLKVKDWAADPKFVNASILKKSKSHRRCGGRGLSSPAQKAWAADEANTVVTEEKPPQSGKFKFVASAPTRLRYG